MYYSSKICCGKIVIFRAGKRVQFDSPTICRRICQLDELVVCFSPYRCPYESHY